MTLQSWDGKGYWLIFDVLIITSGLVVLFADMHHERAMRKSEGFYPSTDIRKVKRNKDTP